MASKERAILEALRTRLQAGLAGATIYMGKSIDAEQDDLPAVTVVVSEPFNAVNEAPNSAKTKVRWRGMFDIQADLKVPGDDPVIDLMDYGRDIRKAVYTPEDLTMGKIANDHRPTQTHPFVPAPGSTIGSVLVRLQVEYTEDY